MAKLEAELLLLGKWKNVEELEEVLTLEELEAIIKASREQEYRAQKFAAALKGVDLDEGESDAQERFEKAKRRAEAKLTGKSEEAIELEALGIDIVTD